MALYLTDRTTERQIPLVQLHTFCSSVHPAQNCHVFVISTQKQREVQFMHNCKTNITIRPRSECFVVNVLWLQVFVSVVLQWAEGEARKYLA